MDEYPDVKKYLEHSVEVSDFAFRRSNFYDIVTEYIGDCASVGTAHILTEEDVNKGRIIFQVPHFRECYIAEDAYGFVNTLYRVCNYKLSQLVEKFGLEKILSACHITKEMYGNNPYQDREVLWAIYPRKERDNGRIDAINKSFSSMWILRGGGNPGERLLEESGFDSFPGATWRWRKNSNEWYGRGPGHDAFVAVMTSNAQGRSNLIAAQKMVEPPIVGTLDMRGQINIGPKGFTYVESMERQMPKPLITGIQLPFAIEQQDRMDNAIKEFFHVPFFLMLWQAAMNKVELTATQVIGMQGEQAAVLGTRVGRLESEACNPIHDRVFEIEQKAGRMPEPPQILYDYSGHRIEIDYIGPLAQAQKRLVKTRSIQAGIQLTAELANIVGPQALDYVDVDNTVMEILESTGFPPSLIRSEDDVREIRAMRQKQQDLAMQTEMITKLAKASQAAGKATQQGSPLDALVNNAQLGASEEGASA